MRPREAYAEFISALMREKIALFGAVAFRRASQVSALQLSSDGTVLRIEGDPLLALEGVLAAFERLSGRASIVTARSVARRIRLYERFPGIELPSVLR
jgi:hypothetical protein